MTETPRSRTGTWILPLLGLCVCLVLVGSMQGCIDTFRVTAGKGVDELPVDEPAPPIELAAEKAQENSTAKLADGEKPPLGQITILVPTKKLKKEGPRKALRVGFDDIDIEKVLNTKQLSLDLPSKMPEWLQHLNGQRVRLRGYMHPGSAFQEEGIKRFTFCRDTSACCFGPDPTIFYLIETTMKSGSSTNYRDREAFDVEGIFRIEPIVQEKTGLIVEFYHLDDAQVVKPGR